jgi:DegV family protein with EDD domain
MSQQASRIALVTDSTSDIPSDLIARHQIIIVPLYVVWGSDELRDSVDIDAATFYSRLPKDPIHPKTSQPTPADFARVIRECGAQEVVAITISKQLSGTFDSVQAARDMVDIPVHAVDSFSVSIGLGFQVLAAARARDAGGDVAAMIAAAQRVRQTLSVLFTVNTLDYLHKGGRIGGAAKFLGTALQLKPMLAADATTGRIEAVERVRTRGKALQRLIEATFERVDPTRPLHVGVINGAAPDDAQALFEEVKAKYNPVEMMSGAIGPVLGVHAGPGVVGICAYSE